MTITKIRTGNFEVRNAAGDLVYRIFNGSAGISGAGQNEYGIVNVSTGKMTKAGSLAKAKKMVAGWIKLAK